MTSHYGAFLARILRSMHFTFGAKHKVAVLFVFPLEMHFGDWDELNCMALLNYTRGFSKLSPMLLEALLGDLVNPGFWEAHDRVHLKTLITEELFPSNFVKFLNGKITLLINNLFKFVVFPFYCQLNVEKQLTFALTHIALLLPISTARFTTFYPITHTMIASAVITKQRSFPITHPAFHPPCLKAFITRDFTHCHTSVAPLDRCSIRHLDPFLIFLKHFRNIYWHFPRWGRGTKARALDRLTIIRFTFPFR